MDLASMADGMTRPGIDPRQWISLGTVDQDSPDAHSVRFVDDEGNPLTTGPLVTVTLQPSGITCVCRVASFIAGVGEGTWSPIQEKDEVLVALPQGEEAANPVIIGRLNQALDTWPQIVAGQDAGGNKFGFWRLRTPFVIESAESFLIRSAKTGSQIGLDPQGQVILNNGDKNNIFIGSDAISISSGDDNTFIQLNFSENRITTATGDARLELSASGESVVFIPGALNIGTSGARGKGNAVTVQQLVGFLANYTIFLKTAGVTGLTGVTLTPAALDVALAAMVFGAASPAPPATPVAAYFGNYTLLPLTFGPAPAGAIAASLTIPLSITDPTGYILGIGRAGLML